MMTKKDFIAIAQELKPLEVPVVVLEALIRVFSRSNPNFNRHRWKGFFYGRRGPNGGKLG